MEKLNPNRLFLRGLQLLKSTDKNNGSFPSDMNNLRPFDDEEISPKQPNSKLFHVHVDLRHEHELRKLRSKSPTFQPKDDMELNPIHSSSHPIHSAATTTITTTDIPKVGTTNGNSTMDDNNSNNRRRISRSHINNNINNNSYYNNHHHSIKNPITFDGSLTELDQCALEVGHLVFQTVLKKPELSVSDSLNRFFIDSWLDKFHSNLDESSKFSIELLADLQRAITEVTSKFTLEDPDDSYTVKKSHQISESTISKTLCGLGMEAYDKLLHELDKTNPVLHEIKRTLLPAIFSEFPFSEAFDGAELRHIERLFQDAESAYQDIPGIGIGNIDNIPPHSSKIKRNQFRGAIDSMTALHEDYQNNDNSDNNDNGNDSEFNSKMARGLTGQKYVRFRTWHESYVEMKNRYKHQETKLSIFFRERDSLYSKINQLESEVNQWKTKYENISDDSDELSNQHKELEEVYAITRQKLVEMEGLYAKEISHRKKSESELVEARLMLKDSLNDPGSQYAQIIGSKYEQLQKDHHELNSLYRILKDSNVDLQQQFEIANNYIKSMEQQQVEYKDQLIKLSFKMANKFRSIRRYHVHDDHLIALASTSLSNLVGPLSPKTKYLNLSSDNIPIPISKTTIATTISTSETATPRITTMTSTFPSSEYSHNQLIDFLCQWNEALSNSIQSYQILSEDLNQTVSSLQDHSYTRDVEVNNQFYQQQMKFNTEIEKRNEEHSKEIDIYKKDILDFNNRINQLYKEIKALDEENYILKESNLKHLEQQELMAQTDIGQLFDLVNTLTDRSNRVEEQRNMLECDDTYYQKYISILNQNDKLKQENKKIREQMKYTENLGVIAIKNMKFMGQRISNIISEVPLSTFDGSSLLENRILLSVRRYSSVTQGQGQGSSRRNSQSNLSESNLNNRRRSSLSKPRSNNIGNQIMSNNRPNINFSQIYEINESIIQATKSMIEEQLDNVHGIVNDLYDYKQDYEDQFLEDEIEIAVLRERYEQISMLLEDKNINKQDEALQFARTEYMKLRDINIKLQSDIQSLNNQILSMQNKDSTVVLTTMIKSEQDQEGDGEVGLSKKGINHHNHDDSNSNSKSNVENLDSIRKEDDEIVPDLNDNYNINDVDAIIDETLSRLSQTEMENSNEDTSTEDTNNLIDLDDLLENDYMSYDDKIDGLTTRFDKFGTKYFRLKDKYKEALNTIQSLQSQCSLLESMMESKSIPIKSIEKTMNDLIQEFRNDINYVSMLPKDVESHDLTHLLDEDDNDYDHHCHGDEEEPSSSAIDISKSNKNRIKDFNSSNNSTNSPERSPPHSVNSTTLIKQIVRSNDVNNCDSNNHNHEDINQSIQIDENNIIENGNDDKKEKSIKDESISMPVPSLHMSEANQMNVHDPSLPSVAYIGINTINNSNHPIYSSSNSLDAILSPVMRASKINQSMYGKRRSIKVLQSTGTRLDISLTHPLLPFNALEDNKDDLNESDGMNLSSSSSFSIGSNKAMLDVIRKNEKEYAKEIGYYAVILREAKQLFKYIQDQLSHIHQVSPIHNTNTNTNSSNDDDQILPMINTLQEEIKKRMDWIFDAKKLHQNFTSNSTIDQNNENENKDNNHQLIESTIHKIESQSTPMSIVSQMRMVKSYNEAKNRLIQSTIIHSPVHFISDIDKNMNTNEDQSSTHLQNSDSNQVLRTIEKVSDDLINRAYLHGGWKTMLYTHNGTIDPDFDLTVWPTNDQIDILQEILSYERSRIDEMKKYHVDTCQSYIQKLKTYRTKSEGLQNSLTELKNSQAANLMIPNMKSNEGGQSSSTTTTNNNNNNSNQNTLSFSLPVASSGSSLKTIIEHGPDYHEQGNQSNHMDRVQNNNILTKDQVQEREMEIYRKVKSNILQGLNQYDDFIISKHDYDSLKASIQSTIQLIQLLTSISPSDFQNQDQFTEDDENKIPFSNHPMNKDTNHVNHSSSSSRDNMNNNNNDAFDEKLLKPLTIANRRMSMLGKNGLTTNHLEIQARLQPVTIPTQQFMESNQKKCSTSPTKDCTVENDVEYVPIAASYRSLLSPSSSLLPFSNTNLIPSYETLQWPQRIGNKATYSNYRFIENIQRREKALQLLHQTLSENRISKENGEWKHRESSSKSYKHSNKPQLLPYHDNNDDYNYDKNKVESKLSLRPDGYITFSRDISTKSPFKSINNSSSPIRPRSVSPVGKKSLNKTSSSSRPNTAENRSSVDNHSNTKTSTNIVGADKITMKLSKEINQMNSELSTICDDMIARVLFTSSPEVLQSIRNHKNALNRKQREYNSVNRTHVKNESKDESKNRKKTNPFNLPSDSSIYLSDDEKEEDRIDESAMTAAVGNDKDNIMESERLRSDETVLEKILSVYDSLYCGRLIPICPRSLEDIYASSDIVIYAKQLNDRVNYHIYCARRLEKVLRQLTENYNDGAIIDYSIPERQQSQQPVYSSTSMIVPLKRSIDIHPMNPIPAIPSSNQSPHTAMSYPDLSMNDSLSFSEQASIVFDPISGSNQAISVPISMSPFLASDMNQDNIRQSHFDVRKEINSKDNGDRPTSFTGRRSRKLGLEAKHKFRHEPAATSSLSSLDLSFQSQNLNKQTKDFNQNRSKMNHHNNDDNGKETEVEAEERPSPLVLMSLISRNQTISRPKTTSSAGIKYQLPPLRIKNNLHE